MTASAGTVEVGTGTVGTRFLENRYPIAEGLIAGTTRQSGDPSLIEQPW